MLLNRDSFSEYNQSATRELNRLMERIKGTPEDRELVNRCRKTGAIITQRDYDKLQGLAIKEYLLYHDTCRDLKGLNVTSSDFMLSQILGIHLLGYYTAEQDSRSFSKNAGLPQLARINFPSRQSLSDILKGKKNASFDAVRKMLILLHFYCFFVSCVLDKDSGSHPYDNCSVYVEDANDQLASCNYGPLYEGNPYDQIFLYSAKTPHPLDTFRDIIGEAVDGE